MCKLSFCSESSSDGCSIVSHCCIPGSSERQHVHRKSHGTTLLLTWLTTLQAASMIGRGGTSPNQAGIQRKARSTQKKGTAHSILNATDLQTLNQASILCKEKHAAHKRKVPLTAS